MLGRLGFRLLDLRRRTDALARLERYRVSERWPPSQMERHRLAALEGMLAQTRRHVPFWSHAFSAAAIGESGASLDGSRRQLSGLPLLDKSLIRAGGEAMRRAGIAPRRRLWSGTGGSTGEPLRYLVTRDDLSHASAAMWRGMGWSGWRPGAPGAVLAGSSLLGGASPLRRWVQKRLIENMQPLSAFHLDAESARHHARLLSKRRVQWVRGYPSALAEMARLAPASAAPSGIRAVFTTAELLTPRLRERIQDFFGAPVRDQYGAMDGTISAHECEEGGMHLAAESCLLEVLSDAAAREVDREALELSEAAQEAARKPRGPGALEALWAAAPGKGVELAPTGRGELVATSLTNTAQPFIRYRVGDRGELIEETCGCGRRLPLIRNLEGRVGEMVVLPDGTRVHSELFSHAVRREDWIASFQIVQEAADRIAFRYVAARTPTTDEASRLETTLARELPGATVRLEEAEALERTPGGKHRFILHRAAVLALLRSAHPSAAEGSASEADR